MKTVIQSTTRTALLFLSQYLRPGETAVDATCGNGHDTVALAEMGAGRIYAFDVQEAAIENTRNALTARGLYSDKVRLIQDGHENMKLYVKEKVQAVVFNLGYRPSGSKDVITGTQTTLEAVSQALSLLKKGGLLCVTMYSGHPGGEEEKEALLAFARSLDAGLYHTAYINMLNQRNHPPEILLITLK